MSYEVFARKYRPQGFAEVLGQDAVVRTLSNAIKQDRLAHAYLFVGPRGVGKTSTARIFAKALNCVKGPTENPCGECDSCREIAAGNSLDMLEIDGASNNGVEQVRELRENVRFMPSHGKFRIYLIDEVHMLSTQAFNALLKTLEEPPAHVKFLFATTEAHKIPATIISRCQRFDLQPIRTDVAAAHLLEIAKNEGIELEASAAEVIARAGEGSMRDAESMLDQVVSFCGNKVAEKDVLSIFGVASAEDVASLLDCVLDGNAAAALELVARLSEDGKDLGHLLSDLVHFTRDLLVGEVTKRGQEGRRGELLKPLHGKFPPRKLTDLLEVLSAAEAGLRFSPDKKLPLEIAVIKSIQLLHTADLDDVLGALAELRGGGVPAVDARILKPQVSASAVKAVPVSSSVAKPSVQESAKPKEAEEARKPIFSLPRQGEPKAQAKPMKVPERVEPPKSRIEEDSAPRLATAGVREVWKGVVDEISSVQRIRSAWLEEMQDISEDAGVLRVVFPWGMERQLKSPTAVEQGKQIEKLWMQYTGRAIQFSPEVTDDVAIAVGAVKDEKLTAEEFENDPAIEAALEIFGATLENEESKKS